MVQYLKIILTGKQKFQGVDFVGRAAQIFHDGGDLFPFPREGVMKILRICVQAFRHIKHAIREQV